MTTPNLKYFLVFCYGICVMACSTPRQEQEITAIYNTLKSLQNKKIDFPANLISSTNGIKCYFPYVTSNSDYKVVVYTDSLGCTPCKFKTGEWSYYVRQLQILSGNIYFVFIFQKESKILEEDFRMQGIEYPVIYDTNNAFIQENKLPASSQFHTFLLDKDNKIILIGSPVGNKKIWELYKEKIRKHLNNCN